MKTDKIEYKLILKTFSLIKIFVPVKIISKHWNLGTTALINQIYKDCSEIFLMKSSKNNIAIINRLLFGKR